MYFIIHNLTNPKPMLAPEANTIPSSGIVHFTWPRNLLRDLKTAQCRGGILDILFKCDTIAAD